jgi:protein-S-isoprenylcysteine O-methyltransferase Ste14
MASAMHRYKIWHRRNVTAMPQMLLSIVLALAFPAPALGEVLSSLRATRVPAPESLVLLGTGLIAVAFWLGWSRRRQARRQGTTDQRR